MKRIVLSIAMILSLILTGCTNNTGNTKLEAELKAKDTKITQLEEKIKELETQVKDQNQSAQNSLLGRVAEAIELIKVKDMKGLSAYVHPTAGLRFSPYDHVDTEFHQLFTAEEVAGLVQDKKVYQWGNYDGSGDPIQITFNDYYDRYIYDEDFANPHMIGNNVTIGKGNSVNNIKEAYPKGHFIEFHFTGLDPKYAGIDWKSLRLVFEEVNGTWYLVGITHGEWTI